jgi:16S rRNA (cytidine1402-2'-O)-methyltransferase
LGDRPAVLAREMTKLHEEFIRGRLSDLQALLADRPSVKGECTLLVGGAQEQAPLSEADLADALREALSRPEAHLSSVSKAMARHYRLPRKTVYDLALQIQKQMAAQGRDG